jgi:hypothetical protein
MENRVEEVKTVNPRGEEQLPAIAASYRTILKQVANSCPCSLSFTLM